MVSSSTSHVKQVTETVSRCTKLPSVTPTRRGEILTHHRGFSLSVSFCMKTTIAMKYVEVGSTPTSPTIPSSEPPKRRSPRGGDSCGVSFYKE